MRIFPSPQLKVEYTREGGRYVNIPSIHFIIKSSNKMTYLSNLTVSYLHLIVGISDANDVMQTLATFCVDELLTSNSYIKLEMEKSSFLANYNVIPGDRMLAVTVDLQKLS